MGTLKIKPLTEKRFTVSVRDLNESVQGREIFQFIDISFSNMCVVCDCAPCQSYGQYEVIVTYHPSNVSYAVFRTNCLSDMSHTFSESMI